MLQPAIELAEDGFPVSPVTAHNWDACLFQIQNQESQGSKAFYTAEGKAPRAGQLQKNIDLGQTFRSLAENGALKGDSSLLMQFLQRLSSFLRFLVMLQLCVISNKSCSARRFPAS